jgi:hypothetical protein
MVEVIDDDLGRSGGGINRPGFERLLAAPPGAVPLSKHDQPHIGTEAPMCNDFFFYVLRRRPGSRSMERRLSLPTAA